MTGSSLDIVPYQEALQLVLDLAHLAPAEPVSLTQSIGRILELDVIAAHDRPAADLSAMDGYAVRYADLSPGCLLPVIGESTAGDPASSLSERCAHRILTGAAMPAGADTVIPQENVMSSPEGILVPALPTLGDNVRRAGEEFTRGDRLIAAGTRLDWRHAAVLASQGIASPLVKRKLHVSILANGKELVLPEAGRKPEIGQIYDSNSPMLAALFVSLGMEAHTDVISSDDAESLHAALSRALANSDIVVTTGGISVGDTDHVHNILHDLGAKVLFRGMTIRPGRPLTVATLGKKVIFGLPGNPTASVVGVFALLMPFIRRAYGQEPLPLTSGILDFEPKKRRDLTQFIFVDLVETDKMLWIRPARSVGSADIMSLLHAKGLLRIDPDDVNMTRGQIASVMRFDSTTGSW